MSWTAYIDVRANGKLSDAQWNEMKKWPEVAQVWSKQGHWDWLICLKPTINSLDALEKFIFNLRAQPWVSETHTWWAKAV